MRRKKKIEIVAALLLAFGMFVNLSSDTGHKPVDIHKNVIVINEDETIDGKH